MQAHRVSDGQRMRHSALKYLENTYQEHFLIEEYAEKSLLVTNDQFKVKSIKYQRSFNLVLNHNNQFEDNYFSLQFEADANRYFNKIIKTKNFNSQARVIIYNNKRPRNLVKNACFEDFMKTGKALIFLYIFTEAHLNTSEKEAILSMIGSNSYVQLGSFVEVTELAAIKKIDNPIEIMAKKSHIIDKVDFTINHQNKLIFEVNSHDEVG